jgi:hypothetical protein
LLFSKLNDLILRKWQIEKSFFDKEVMGYDQKTKKDIPWPFDASPSFGQYKEYIGWLDQVQDKVTKKFFKGRDKSTVEYDNDGKEIPGTVVSIDLEPHFERTQIIRLRTKDKGEILYSRGIITGYNNFQNPITTSFQEPEIWNEQQFHHRTEFIQNLNTVKDICVGPAGVIPHYTLPFTPENVDELMKNAITNVALKVKHEGGKVKDAPDLDRFRNKSFDYNLNMDYMTEKEKAAKLEEFQAMQQGAKKKPQP